MASNFQSLIGLTREEALVIAKPMGINVIRARWIDGEAMMGTADWRTDRLNVSIDNDKITSVGGIG